MANITRIKNNQITDANVVAYAKMTPGTITGNLISSTLTMSSNVTIIGNLNVTGNSAIINSVNTYIQDPIVVFNAGYVNSITNYDIGMLVNRNLNNLGPYGAVNTAWVWVENDQAFAGITTATTGNAITNLTNAGYANLKIGNVTAVGLVVNNNLTAGTITATPISGSTGYFTTLYGTNFSTANAQISGGAITTTPISGSTGYFTTSQATNFSTGNAVISGGYISALANAAIGTAVVTNFSTGNAVISGGYAYGLSNVYATTAQATNFSSGNVFVSGGYLTGLANVYSTLGQFTNISSGNVLFTGGAITGLTDFTATRVQATNFSTGNAVISGGYISALANATIATAVVTNFSTGNAQITGGALSGVTGNFTTLQATNFSSGNAVISGGSINATPIGNSTASTGAFTTLTSSGVATFNGNLVAASGTNSASTTTGALVVAGGAGVSGNVNAGAVYDSGNRVVSTSSGAGNLAITGPAISLSLIGNGPVNAGNALSIPTIVTDAYGRVVSLTSNTITQTWTLNGTGGTTAVTEGTTLSFAGTYGVTVTVGNEYANIATPQDLRTTASPSFNGLQVTSLITANSLNAAVIGNIGTILTATSSTINTEVVTNFSTANARITGGAITATPISGSTGYFTTAQATNFSSGNILVTGGALSGLTSVYSTLGQFTNFSTGNAVISGGYITVANVTAGPINGTYLVASSGLSTANVVITGGSINGTPIGNTTPNTGAFSTLTASGLANVTNATASTSTSTGAFVVTGGAGIGGDVWIGGNLNVLGVGTSITVNREVVLTTEVVAGNLVANSGVDSTSTSNGALVVKGGVGVSGNVWIGSNLVAAYGYATNFSTANAQITGGAISATPVSGSTGYFTTAQATNISSGNVLFNGGKIDNTLIGSVTPAAATFAALTANGLTTLNGNIVSTITTPNNGVSTTSGALQLAGGAGIAGNLTVGGNVTVDGNINIIANVNAVTVTSASGVFYGNAAGFGALYAGITTGYAVQTQTVFQNSTNFNGYAQVNHQNINHGPLASGDFVVTADNGNAADTYIDMGMASSTYDFPGFPLIKPNDGYLLVTGNTVTGGGNLVLTTGAANDIVFGPNNVEYGRITSGNVFAIKSTVSSTSTTTGAVTVAGGLGVAGNINVAGIVQATSATFLSINNTVIGNLTPQTGSFTALNATTGFSTANAVITGGYATNLANVSTTGTIVAGGNIVAESGAVSTSVTTGAVVVRGGLGVGSNIALGGNLILNNTIGVLGQVVTATASGSQWVTPLFYTIYNGTSNVNIATPGGAVTVGVNNANIATVSSTGLSVNGQISVNGAYITDIAGNIVIANAHGGSIMITDDTPGQATLTAGTLIANSGAAADGSVNNGALQVYGGAKITGNLFAATFDGAIGQHNPSTGVFNTIQSLQTIVSSGNIVAEADTPSVSTSTGGLVVVNGAGIGGNLNVSGVTKFGSNVYIQSNLIVTGSTTTATNLNVLGVAAIGGGVTLAGNLLLSSGVPTNDPTSGALVIPGIGGASINGNVYIGQSLFVGVGSQSPSLINALVVQRGTSGAGAGVQYTQAALVNTTNTGSSDWIAYGDNYPGPSYDHGWADMGFTGSAFNDPNFSITGPNDSYFFGSAADSAFGGNLVLATDYSGFQRDIIFATGSFYANAEVARFHGNTSNSGNFTIKLPTNAAPAANVGALQVWGGSSISGNTYIGQAITINGSRGSGNDVIIKGVSDQTLLWARPSSGYDQVVIGGSALTSDLVTGAKLQVYSTDSMLLPAGTTGQRPGTSVAGMFRYNSTLGAVEWFNGASWKAAESLFTVIADQQFNGDGTTTAFTIASNQTTSSCIVSVNGIIQIPTLAYSVSGTILTFTEAPQSGDVIDVRELTSTTTPTALYDTSSYNTVTVSNTGVQITTGTSSAVPVVGWDVNGARINNNANVTVASAGTSTIDSFFANTYSSAEYTITGTISGTNIRQISKVLVASAGGTASISTYGSVTTNANTLATFSVTVSGGSVNLQSSATNTNMIYKIDKLYQTI
jgi:hypothetical protein